MQAAGGRALRLTLVICIMTMSMLCLLAAAAAGAAATPRHHGGWYKYVSYIHIIFNLKYMYKAKSIEQNRHNKQFATEKHRVVACHDMSVSMH